MRSVPWLMLALLLTATAAQAGGDAVVESVQSPAWVERDGASAPLVPGMALRSGDNVRTGAESRLYLKLAEGSRVKLGENARFAVGDIGTRNDGVFSAAFRVLTGAFRFTTAALARPRPRDVSIQVATITAGVRGTDLWGKSGDSRDLVCLLEGKIDVSHESGASAQLTEPLSFFAADRNTTPKPVSKVTAQQVMLWAAETEIVSGAGAASSGGGWKVYLARRAEAYQAFKPYMSAREAGYPAELRPRRNRQGGFRYDVVVGGLRTSMDAQTLATRLSKTLSLDGLAVGR